MSLVGWCLQRSVRVGWCLQGFVSVGIGVCSRLVPTKNYKEIIFVIFFCKGFHLNLVFYVL